MLVNLVPALVLGVMGSVPKSLCVPAMHHNHSCFLVFGQPPPLLNVHQYPRARYSNQIPHLCICVFHSANRMYILRTSYWNCHPFKNQRPLCVSFRVVVFPEAIPLCSPVSTVIGTFKEVPFPCFSWGLPVHLMNYLLSSGLLSSPGNKSFLPSSLLNAAETFFSTLHQTSVPPHHIYALQAS